MEALEDEKRALERRIKALEEQLRELRLAMARASEAASAGHDAQVKELSAQLADFRRNAEVSARLLQDTQAQCDQLRTAERAAAEAAEQLRREGALALAQAVVKHDEALAAAKREAAARLEAELGRREREHAAELAALRKLLEGKDAEAAGRVAEAEREAESRVAVQLAAAAAQHAAAEEAYLSRFSREAQQAADALAAAERTAAAEGLRADGAAAEAASAQASIAHYQGVIARQEGTIVELSGRLDSETSSLAAARSAAAEASAAAESQLAAERQRAAAALAARVAEYEAVVADLRLQLEAATARAEAAAASRTRRVTWAFTAARNLMQMQVEHAQRELANYRARFDARESRQDDVVVIQELTQTVAALEEKVAEAEHVKQQVGGRGRGRGGCCHLSLAAVLSPLRILRADRMLSNSCFPRPSHRQQFALEMDNREKNDALFGPRPPPPNSLSRNLERKGPPSLAAAAATMRRVQSARPSSAVAKGPGPASPAATGTTASFVVPPSR